MAYSEEQRALRTAAERFAREKLAPRYQTREQEGRIDRALVREMGALGLIAGDLAESHGGLGLSSETTGLIMEALAYGDVNVAYVQLLGSLCGQIIARHATEDIAATWLPRIVSGESLVALALTEPRGGSDAAESRLVGTAERHRLCAQWREILDQHCRPGRCRFGLCPHWEDRGPRLRHQRLSRAHERSRCDHQPIR